MIRDLLSEFVGFPKGHYDVELSTLCRDLVEMTVGRPLESDRSAAIIPWLVQSPENPGDTTVSAPTRPSASAAQRNLECEGQRRVSEINVVVRARGRDKSPVKEVGITRVSADITIKLPVH